MYLLEKDAKDTKMKTYADSLWWGVVSLKFLTYFILIQATSWLLKRPI
jgi:hypothetical protein